MLSKGIVYIPPIRHVDVSSLSCFYILPGDIAQLARASALQAEGLGFESPYLQDVIIVKIFTDVL